MGVRSGSGIHPLGFGAVPKQPFKQLHQQVAASPPKASPLAKKPCGLDSAHEAR